MTSRLWLVLVVVATLIASLAYVRSRFLVVELSYELAKKQQIKSELEQKKQELSLELSTLKSPKRIEKIARQKLGLGRSESGVSVVLVQKGDR